MNFKWPISWPRDSFLRPMSYPLSTHPIMLNENAEIFLSYDSPGGGRGNIFVIQFPRWGDGSNIFVIRFPRWGKGKYSCHTIPQVGGGGSTLSSHPIPALVIPFLRGVNTFKWWKYTLQNASEMYSKSGNLAIWPFLFLCVSNGQINQNLANLQNLSKRCLFGCIESSAKLLLCTKGKCQLC